MSENAVLLMRLEGPMQAWGGASKWVVRDTDDAPTLSGVVGMICATLGRRRDEPLDKFTGVEMAVRVDREGMVVRDYHTVGAGIGNIKAEGGIKYSHGTIETLVSERYYLCDASFLVVLLAPAASVEKWAERLQNPVWPVYLGRKSCPPSVPVFEDVAQLGGGRGKSRSADRLLEVLKGRQWRPRLESIDKPPERVRIQLPAEMSDPGAYPRPDVPLSFRYRQFDVRYVRDVHVPIEEFDVGDELQTPMRKARRYVNYRSSKWLRKSRECRARAGHLCCFCGLPAEHTHHMTYEHAGEERDEELRALCHICHDAVTMLEAERDARPHGIDPLSEAFRDLVLERRERLLKERFKRDFRERRLEDVLRVISQD